MDSRLMEKTANFFNITKFLSKFAPHILIVHKPRNEWVSTIRAFVPDRVKLNYLIVHMSIIYRLKTKGFCLQMEASVKLQEQIKRPVLDSLPFNIISVFLKTNPRQIQHPPSPPPPPPQKKKKKKGFPIKEYKEKKCASKPCYNTAINMHVLNLPLKLLS